MAFKKGQSGNPGGRPKVVAEVRDLAREHTEDALKALVAIMEDTKSPAAARVSAATAILDRGYGRPAQTLEHAGKDGGPIETVDVTEFELVRRIAFVLAKAADEKDTVH